MEEIIKILFTKSPMTTPVSEVVQNAIAEIAALRAKNAKLREALEIAESYIDRQSGGGETDLREMLNSALK